MNNELKEIFSLRSAPILIAVAGFLSALVTMFIDINIKISIRWTICLVWISITIIIILLKIIIDGRKNSKASETKTAEVPFSSLPDKNIFIIRKNDLFSHNSVVGCFWEEKDGIETLAFVGVVHHVQEKLIQIRVIKNLIDPLQHEVFTTIGMSKIIIRPVIPFDIIQEITGDL
ncbi:hypothetical protein [Enterobacter hormaechei]|uniref:hypothetical protein n=1 Tax=Enterobacter hormaechei TaxID=158836 RepID=UPI001981BF23|nr:hypothetical protein [Enterobacter hormaechei]MBN4832455.1 hypothetical protein [Enterobacter hormaechei]